MFPGVNNLDLGAVGTLSEASCVTILATHAQDPKRELACRLRCILLKRMAKCSEV